MTRVGSVKFNKYTFLLDTTQSKGMLALLDKLDTLDDWLESKEKQIKP